LYLLLDTLPTRALSSDLHIAIVMMACGILGAYIAQLSSEGWDSLSRLVRNFMLGLAAGFVGLLAGLFTERAYNLLAFLVDQCCRQDSKGRQRGSRIARGTTA
jgi:hypothetical protein